MNNKVELLTAAVIIIVLIASASAAAFDGDSFYGEEKKTEIEVSGELSPEFRFFSDADQFNENLKGNLEITYPGKRHEFKFLLDFQAGAVEEIEFDELYYKYYGEQYNLLIGKERPIWGKGDMVHVVDNINAEDLSDFINPDYKDRQIGEEMIKIDRYFRGGNANLEFIYTPDFTPDRLADDPDSQLGNWIINPFVGDKNFSLDKIAAATGQTQTELVNQVESSIKKEDNQYAIRFTDSSSGTDYGFSYYRGYLREPSYDLKALNNISLNNNPTTIAGLKQNKKLLDNALEAAEIHYDEVDVFGFELAKVIANINSRFELAYYRTDDTDGENPTVRNNKIAWVIGGDRDLPISNLNLNLQLTGEKILDYKQIEKNKIADQNIDIDYNENGDYTTNRAILQLEDSFRNEKIIPSLAWVYNLNDNDYILEAAVEYELKQDLIVNFSHKIFAGDADSTFGQFDENDFSSIGINYSF